MSTTMPESVSTANTMSTTTTSTTNSASAPSSTRDNPAAALDPLTTSSSSSSTKTTELMNDAKAAAYAVGSAIESAAVKAGHAISSAAHNVDAKYHIHDKVSDASAHVSAALKQGHPVHAAKYANAAAVMGEAERAKHEQGPLPADAHAAGASSASTSTTTTLGSKESTTDKISNTASDVASHAQAALSHGHPLNAVKYAPTAAMVGQVEREKHAHGPLEDEASIKAADARDAATTTK